MWIISEYWSLDKCDLYRSTAFSRNDQLNCQSSFGEILFGKCAFHTQWSLAGCFDIVLCLGFAGSPPMRYLREWYTTLVLIDRWHPIMTPKPSWSSRFRVIRWWEWVWRNGSSTAAEVASDIPSYATVDREISPLQNCNDLFSCCHPLKSSLLGLCPPIGYSFLCWVLTAIQPIPETWAFQASRLFVLILVVHFFPSMTEEQSPITKMFPFIR